FDPENRLIFAVGPLAGFKGVSGSRWQVCGKSALTTPEYFNYSNLGGNWGAQLKLAGYDALVIQGKSEKPVYILIQDETVEIRDASTLWGKSTVETREILKEQLGSSVNVVATGPAGENMVTFASVLADKDASGSSGLGAVMGSKNLKAIAVRGSGKVKVANPQRYRELADYARELRTGFSMGITPGTDQGMKLKKDYCYGCTGGFCFRGTYKASNGKVGKYMCGSATFYVLRARKYYGESNEVPFFANMICNEFGVDTHQMDVMMQWLSKCHRAGILTDENTGIPLSQQGSLEFIETLVRKIGLREGIGDVLAQGTIRAADAVGQGAKELLTDYITDSGHFALIDGPRMYISTGLLYATEPRQPMGQLNELGSLNLWLMWVHKQEGAFVSNDVFRAIGRRFLGSEAAVDFTTYEGKALAAKMIQDRECAKDSLILCSYLFPIMFSRRTDDHVGDPTVESKILSAITGNEIDEDGLYRIGERIFNVQRAILAREGHRGRECDRISEYNYTKPLKFDLHNPELLSPGKGDEVVSKKGAVLDREKFEEVKGEYYSLRGWDVGTGLQTRPKLEELGLKDVVEDLERRGLIAG
ncbi:MAG: aldehyde ferredoxin oxidoreductase N-terminal domain-containing protein, partial [Dehalococcoidia bacterium]